LGTKQVNGKINVAGGTALVNILPFESDRLCGRNQFHVYVPQTFSSDSKHSSAFRPQTDFGSLQTRSANSLAVLTWADRYSARSQGAKWQTLLCNTCVFGANGHRFGAVDVRTPVTAAP
jgi:hypothetical protein